MVKRAPRHAHPAVPWSFAGALLLALAALLASGGSGQASHVTFVVATTADHPDSTPGDGLCRKGITIPPLSSSPVPCGRRS